MGKRLSAENKDDEARFAWAVADALLADLNSFGIGVNQAYDTARSYSRVRLTTYLLVLTQVKF